MGKVVVHKSMSLDGFVTGPDVRVDQAMGAGGERLHEWMFVEDVDPADAQVAAENYSTERVGAVLMGRTHFTVGIGHWGEDGAFRMPCFVVTHRPAEPVVTGPTTFTFVTDGLGAALGRAQDAAGDKDVNVMGASISRQLLAAGLVDEVRINLVPVLLGDGARLFDGLGPDGPRFERTRVVDSPRATHVTYRVVR
jgi:dihydrofolate reductase